MSARTVLIAQQLYRDRRAPCLRLLEKAGLERRFNEHGRRLADS